MKQPANKPKICHDRLLPRDVIRPQMTARVGGMSRAIIVFRKMWPNGSNLRVRFMGGRASQKALAKTQANWWSQYANLTFEFNDALDAEIRVAFNPNDGAWSYIGTDCLSIPRNQPTMNLGFQDGGTSAHEFGHAIGLAHEHQNPEGGIIWNEPVVIQNLSGPPNNWDENEIRHNVIEKYSANQIRGTKFDGDSIMLYFFPKTWTLNGIETKENNILSKLDKEFIASGQAYPKTADQPVTLSVNPARATSAAIGAPGEEDLFTFKATKKGNYVIATGGKTDVVMKLYGPDNPTALIAEDDDSGTGLNARIATNLVPGTYLVQIRHFNKTKGTGKYSIKVIN